MLDKLNIVKRHTDGAAGNSNRNELHTSGTLPSSEPLQAIRDDYRSGRLETVQGWIVAKTEAELIGLAEPETENPAKKK